MAVFYKYEYTNKTKNIHPWLLVSHLSLLGRQMEQYILKDTGDRTTEYEVFGVLLLF